MFFSFTGKFFLTIALLNDIHNMKIMFEYKVIHLIMGGRAMSAMRRTPPLPCSDRASQIPLVPLQRDAPHQTGERTRAVPAQPHGRPSAGIVGTALAGLGLLSLWLGALPGAQAQVTNGTTTIRQETMTSGGGRVGSGNPMSATTVIGETVGGVMVSSTVTIRLNAHGTLADTTPPTGTVSINGGAASTNTTAVTLTLTATDQGGLVTQMQCSNDPVTYTAPEAYATTTVWTLSTGDGSKTVSVKYGDAAGNWSQAATATIVLDTTAPTLATVSVSAVSATTASITWTTSEPATSQVDYGLTSALGSVTPLDSTLVTAHAVTLQGLSANTLYNYRVRSTDGAGNVATSAPLTFTTSPPDTTPPYGSVTINSDASATSSLSVTLMLSATDDSGTVAQMRCSNDGLTYAPPAPYAASTTWTLSSGDGSKAVFVTFADAAGNWSSPVSASIRLDTTPPAITVSSPRDGDVLTAP